MDASAILAHIQEEKGGHIVGEVLIEAPCWITTVNICEVLTKCCDNGMSVSETQNLLQEMGLIVIDFDLELALQAAAMRPLTKPIGASLGDRACLALAQRAMSEGSPIVYTTEHGWTKIKWPFKVVLLRSRHESAKQ